MSAAEVIGRIEIPASALKHRFVIEAEACAKLLAGREDARSQVVGTANSRRCELYGWAPNVDSHVDQTGYVYLCCLNPGTTELVAWDFDDSIELAMASLDQGVVVRLNDHMLHWTEDHGHRVAAFVGSWQWPADEEAMQILRGGIEALARGDYYSAPRVRAGFRVLMDDECLVANAAFDELEPALLADAEKAGRYIERCGQCTRPAVRPDDMWPYFNEWSRCRDHMQRTTA